MFVHQSVLLDAVVEALDVRPGGRWLDGTLGGGGHSQAILEASGPDGVLVGIDRDPAALAAASARLARFGERFVAVHGRFGDVLDLAGPGSPVWQGPYDGMLLDIGVSSPQLDHADRGFSFRNDGPLDMRMDPTRGETAAQLLDRLDLDELTRILRTYGEEPRAHRIARAILDGRPWTRTVPLAECVARASGYRDSRTHPATRTFQALRIVVNDELGELDRALAAADGLIAPGGRLVIISFHSLEDRACKHAFRQMAGVDADKDAYGNPLTPPAWRLVGRRGVSGKQADAHNPRARSARLRTIEKLPLP
ncbi:MAG: 16S rRNA (cytosine(1402)-N(4))-methyltransferase RsmH [Alphaproteobacteria bacterium]|nr:16S rRNA (cytosine(1402)-N(4))-methyltransferase RsmH [Alphaproteobacteria bacterium]